MQNRRKPLLMVLFMGLCILSWLVPAVAEEPAECTATCVGDKTVSCECTGSGASCTATNRDEPNKVRGGCAATDNDGCYKVEQCPPLID